MWCLSRLVVVAVLNGLPERPRGGDQGLRRGQADEGAAEERAAGPGREGGRCQQPQPQQRTLRQGKPQQSFKKMYRDYNCIFSNETS